MGKKWEYKLVNWEPGWFSDGNARAVEEQLNKQGGEGWELVKFDWTILDVSCRMLFKRPLEE